VISPLDAFLLVLVVATGAAVLSVRGLLGAVIVFGAFSFFSAAFFASLGALDVAFTEAAVGAAITTVLFVTVIHRVDHGAHGAQGAPRRPPRAFALASATALAAVTLVLGRAVLQLPPVGDPEAPAARHVSPRYIEKGPAETGAPNMVTAVLADYRGYDTLGETVVILTAGLACALVLGTLGPLERRP
jgi:multicomponent Na+:H+ antiporter subunit B